MDSRAPKPWEASSSRVSSTMGSGPTTEEAPDGEEEAVDGEEEEPIGEEEEPEAEEEEAPVGEEEEAEPEEEAAVVAPESTVAEPEAPVEAEPEAAPGSTEAPVAEPEAPGEAEPEAEPEAAPEETPVVSESAEAEPEAPSESQRTTWTPGECLCGSTPPKTSPYSQTSSSAKPLTTRSKESPAIRKKRTLATKIQIFHLFYSALPARGTGRPALSLLRSRRSWPRQKILFDVSFLPKEKMGGGETFEIIFFKKKHFSPYLRRIW